MSILIFFALALAIVALMTVMRLKLDTTGGWSEYEKRESLFSPEERAFLKVLEQAVDERCRIFGKVSLGDILRPVKGLSPGKQASAANRINRKHVGFVVCSADDMAVRCVIQLAEQPPGQENRSRHDGTVNRFLKEARIPVLRFSARKGYTLDDVRAKVSACLAGEAVADGDDSDLTAEEP